MQATLGSTRVAKLGNGLNNRYIGTIVIKAKLS